MLDRPSCDDTGVVFAAVVVVGDGAVHRGLDGFPPRDNAFQVCSRRIVVGKLLHSTERNVCLGIAAQARSATCVGGGHSSGCHRAEFVLASGAAATAARVYEHREDADSKWGEAKDHAVVWGEKGASKQHDDDQDQAHHFKHTPTGLELWLACLWQPLDAHQ